MITIDADLCFSKVERALPLIVIPVPCNLPVLLYEKYMPEKYM
jgi:hypothetical protein